MDIITILYQVTNLTKRLFKTFIILSSDVGHVLCQILAVLLQLACNLLKVASFGIADFRCFIENLPCVISESLCLARNATNYVCYYFLHYLNTMLQTLETIANFIIAIPANVCYYVYYTAYYMLLLAWGIVVLIAYIIHILFWPAFVIATLIFLGCYGWRLFQWSLKLMLVLIYVLFLALQKCLSAVLSYPTKICWKFEREQLHSAQQDSLLDSNLFCVICYERPKQVLLLPCKHLCLCEICAGSTEMFAAPCPLCRTTVVHKLTVFV